MKIFNNLKVDKIYCLYIEEFLERKEKALKHFKEMKLDVQMFKGSYYPNKGHYGCKMGHLDIIQDAKNNNYNNILIVEDDVFFRDNFQININIPQDFGLFYLGYYDYNNLSIRDENSDKYMKNSKYKLLRMFYTRSTFAYICNKKTYDSILNVRPHNTHFNQFIDMFYANIIQNKFKCYGLYPMPCIINKSKSSINLNETDNETNSIVDDIIKKSEITFNKPIDEKFNNLVKKGEFFIYNDLQFLNGFNKN